MKLSTRGRYACRAMLELVDHYGNGSLSIDRIAESQRISKRYLEHIFARLRKADIVEGMRGSKGGYELKRAPRDITVGEVVRAVEGPLGPVHCVDDPETCPRSGHCAAHELWAAAADALNELLDGRTLQNLADRQKRLDAEAKKAHNSPAAGRSDGP